METINANANELRLSQFQRCRKDLGKLGYKDFKFCNLHDFTHTHTHNLSTRVVNFGPKNARLDPQEGLRSLENYLSFYHIQQG